MFAPAGDGRRGGVRGTWYTRTHVLWVCDAPCAHIHIHVPHKSEKFLLITINDISQRSICIFRGINVGLRPRNLAPDIFIGCSSSPKPKGTCGSSASLSCLKVYEEHVLHGFRPIRPRHSSTPLPQHQHQTTNTTQTPTWPSPSRSYTKNCRTHHPHHHPYNCHKNVKRPTLPCF